MADLDHQRMWPPFLWATIDQASPSGDRVIVWQLRVSQPNVSHVPTDVMHSLEHFLIFGLRAASESVVFAAPMGCATGFYILALTDDADVMADLVAKVLADIATATEVPHADVVHCGWALHHSLPGAKEVARWLLSRRDEWGDPGPEVAEVS